MKKMTAATLPPDSISNWTEHVTSDYILLLAEGESEVIVQIEEPTSPEGPSTLVVTIPPDMLVRIAHLDEAHSA